MKMSQYLKESEKLDANYPTIHNRWNWKRLQYMHAALGMSGECGEIVDMIKKHLIFDKPLDVDKLEEEVGDFFFYLAILFRASGLSLPKVLKQNMKKLNKRFPNGFTEKAAIERRDKK